MKRNVLRLNAVLLVVAVLLLTAIPFVAGAFTRFDGGVNFNPVATLSDGANLQVIGQSEEWFRINHSGTVRYVHSRYIDRTSYSAPTNFEPFIGRTTPASLNVRTGPGLNFNSVATLSGGTNLQIIGQSGEWFRISHGGATRYVYSRYVRNVGVAQMSPPDADFEQFRGRVTATVLNLRSGPGTNFIRVGALFINSTVYIVGQSGLWWRINHNGTFGYVHSNYIQRIAVIPPQLEQSPVEEQPPVEPPPVEQLPVEQPPVAVFDVFTARVVVNFATMRNGPGTSFGTGGNLPNNSHILITGQYGDWFKFAFNGTDRYIHVTNVVNADLDPMDSSFEAFTGVSNGYLPIFGGQSYDHPHVGNLVPGQNVRITGRYESWWQVTANGVVGYINSDHISHTFSEPARPNIVERTRPLANTASHLERAPERIVFHHNAGHRASCTLFNATTIANGPAADSYHFMIAPCGTIFEGRPLAIIDGQAHGFRAAHTSAFNDDIGIAFLGHYDRSSLTCSHGCQHSAPDQLTQAQKQATVQLTQWLVSELNMDVNQSGIIGPITMHHQYSNTLCPGVGPETWINNYLIPQTNSWIQFFR